MCLTQVKKGKTMDLEHFCKSLDLTIPINIIRLSQEEADEIIEYIDAHAPKERFIGSGRNKEKGWYVKYRPSRY